MAKRVVPVEAEKPELTIEQIIERVSDRIAHSRAPRSDWNRTLQMISIAMGLIAIIFSAGISWSRIGAVESRLSDVERRQTEFDTRNRSDLERLGSKLDAVAQTVAEIKGQLSNPRQTPQASR